MGIMVQALVALLIALVFRLAGYFWGKRKVSQVKKEAFQRQRPVLGGLFFRTDCATPSGFSPRSKTFRGKIRILQPIQLDDGVGVS